MTMITEPNLISQVNRPLSMKKDGIQTRKRKPKSMGGGGGGGGGGGAGAGGARGGLAGTYAQARLPPLYAAVAAPRALHA